eukprot:TRINITY_DN2575_c0_g1_i1.p1 TRINITY_DN2575_c0_g1~~TRINITY_DN2575_c0_g1_i1.p1  ORF type:complete len:201 (+),score=35.84 TRINITY_DN2575_c0_g1_i1:35-604(+)
MTKTMLKLIFQVPLDEKEDIGDIPNPYLELGTHTILKSVQAGTLLGTVVVGPALALSRPATRSLMSVITTSGRYGRLGALSSVPFGFLLLYIKTQGLSKEPIFDRAFALRHNAYQHRADRFFLLGALSGYLGGFFCPLGTAVCYSWMSSAGLLSSGAHECPDPGHGADSRPRGVILSPNRTTTLTPFSS